MKFLSVIVIVGAVFGLAGCEGGGASGATPDEPLSNFFKSMPDEPVYPEENPYSESKETLGEFLFWDPILSGELNVACASCHHPDHGWADGRAFSVGSDGIGLGPNRIGFEETDIHSPSIINVAFAGLGVDTDEATFVSGGFFWDLRAATLEEQALQPIKSDIEMRGYFIPEEEILPTVVDRLNEIPEYVAYFESAFEERPAITPENIGKAIATFQRKVMTARTRFDDYLDGDETALSTREITGLNKFVNGGCARCHSGVTLSDNTIHLDQPVIRGKDAVRTQGLRNVELTSPYMHDGSRESLRSAVSLYDERDDLEVIINEDDFGDIVTFLLTLTDNNVYSEIPVSVPSGLKVGGDFDL